VYVGVQVCENGMNVVGNSSLFKRKFQCQEDLMVVCRL
jgi:hypothetical protein